MDNLLGSLILAGTFTIPEVCLFFHHTLYRGNRTTKVSSSSFEAFASPNCEPLAKVTGLGININWNLVRRAKALAKFEVQSVLETSHVACLRIFPGIRPEMLDSVLRVAGLKGLILETFGAGNAPAGEDGILTEVIHSAVQRGIVIVNVSQCYNGTVSPLYAPATILGKAGVVFGHDLTTEAALTKLFFLLANPVLSYEDVVYQMGLSLRGEMTEHSSTQFSHPSTDETSLSAKFTALAYAIAAGDKSTVIKLCTADSHQILDTIDYNGDTALHIAARGPNADVLRELLLRGASVHTRNNAGENALNLAEKANKSENADLLRQAGAHHFLSSEELGSPKLAKSALSRPDTAEVLRAAQIQDAELESQIETMQTVEKAKEEISEELAPDAI